MKFKKSDLQEQIAKESEQVRAALRSIGQPFYTNDMAAHTGLTPTRAQAALRRLQTLGVVAPVSLGLAPAGVRPSKVRALWSRVVREQGKVERSSPICPQSMPNGDQAFWEKHTAQMMAPARLPGRGL